MKKARLSEHKVVPIQKYGFTQFTSKGGLCLVKKMQEWSIPTPGIQAPIKTSTATNLACLRMDVLLLDVVLSPRNHQASAQMMHEEVIVQMRIQVKDDIKDLTSRSSNRF